MLATKKLSCQNKGCGKYFEADSEEECLYHSGGPAFHDGLKGWSCCSKRVVEFDAFLKIPGCTSGKHSVEVAAAPVQATPVAKADLPVKMNQVNLNEQKVSNDPKTEVFQASTSGPVDKMVVPKISESELMDKSDAIIDVGVKCKRPSCGKEYVGSESRTEECIYHEGSPVFHEGSKGWSCCSRKVLEFEEFLKIAGCKKGVHRFTSGQEGPVVVECRKDWYQTPDKIIVSIFAKKVNKEKTTIKFEETKLYVDILFQDESIFVYHTDLFQPIRPAESSFNIMSTKIEIQLAKGNGMSWAAIEPKSDVTSWTTFGLTGTGGGTVGAKEALIAGDAPIHLLQK